MLTVEDAVKSDPKVRASNAGSRIIKGAAKVPRWVWFFVAAGIGYAIIASQKSKAGDISNSDIGPPG